MQDSKAKGGAAPDDRTRSSNIGVLLVVAHRATRDGIAQLLSSHVRLQGAVGSAEEAVVACERNRPDVVVAEVATGDAASIALVRGITERRLARRVLAMGDDDPEPAMRAFEAGAAGFVVADAAPEELVRSVAAVDRGDVVLTPSVARYLVDRAVRVGASLPRGDQALNAGEVDVLVLVAQGSSNQEIARRLIVSESTVKARIGRLFTKLRCRDRAQLVVVAYESGLVRAGSGSVEPWWSRG